MSSPQPVKVRLEWSLVIEGATEEGRKQIELAASRLAEQIEAHLYEALTANASNLNIKFGPDDEGEEWRDAD